MAVSRTRLGLVLVVMVVLAATALWGRAWYQAKQEREVLAPQRLFEHLREVYSKETPLQAGQVQWAQLKPIEVARIQEALTADLEATPHPDPVAAVSLLLPRAIAHLEKEAGAVSALESWLRVSTGDDWAPLLKQPDRWLVKAGSQCLELVLHQSEPEVVWQWVAVLECPEQATEASEAL